MDRLDFAAATSVTPLDQRVDGGAFPAFRAVIHPGWTIGGRPNGGYLLAILARAALAVSPHSDVLAASAHYLHSPDPGPVRVEVELLRGGHSASQLRARMSQDGLPCIEALFTSAGFEGEREPFWSGGLPGRSLAAQADCVRLPPRTPTGIPVELFDQVELRIDPATLAWASGEPSGVGELRGWLALSPDAASTDLLDSVALLFAVDALPPASFDIAPSGWVPTLELTAYIRARPAPGPLQVLQLARLIDQGRLDEACFVWDNTGRLVAQSTQLAGIRLG